MEEVDKEKVWEIQTLEQRWRKNATVGTNALKDSASKEKERQERMGGGGTDILRILNSCERREEEEEQEAGDARNAHKSFCHPLNRALSETSRHVEEKSSVEEINALPFHGAGGKEVEH